MSDVCGGVDLHGGEGKITSGVCVGCVWGGGRPAWRGRLK